MSQATIDIVASTTSGSDLATLLNNWRAALHSSHSGTSAPAYATTGLTWLDTTSNPYILKMYDGADWIRVFAIDTSANIAFPLIQSPRFNFPLAGGTGNAQTITLTLAVTAYTDGDVYTFEAVATNTGATTLNINGVGALAIRKMNSSGADVALIANDILDGGRYTVNFDSAANGGAGAFILVQPSLDLASLSGTLTDSQLPARLRISALSVTPGTGSTNGFNTTGSGWYLAAGGATGNPNGSDGFNHHYQRYNSSYGVDDAFAPAVGLHYRRYWDNGTWSSWQRIYDTSSEVQSLVDNALVSIGYGSVASYAWLYYSGGAGGEGGSQSGSGLYPAGFTSNESSVSADATNGETRGTRGSGAESGTWRRQGRSGNSGTTARWILYFRTA